MEHQKKKCKKSKQAKARNQSNAQRLRAQHDANTPYRHIVLDPLISPSDMRRIVDEAKGSMRAILKETDLFKVYQTCDLGNLPASLMISSQPTLLSLRTALYSASFRSFVQSITGCSPLTDRVDCSANAYAQGCHLLCHDDVIGTRCVSYIVYLTDPDDDWTADKGGALEIYDIDAAESCEMEDKQGVPRAEPSRTVLPKFNTMLLFAVQPGRSYHSVQEVFTDASPRLSISGWYHAKDPPAGSDLASLKQIMTAGDDGRGFNPIPCSPSSSSAEMDAAYLAQWLNPLYLQPSQINKIRKKFIKESSIRLGEFLRDDISTRLRHDCAQRDEGDKLGRGRVPSGYGVGSGNGWRVVGPAHKRRHMVYEGGACLVGEELLGLREGLLLSDVFARYVTAVSTVRATGSRDEVRRFRPGLDYSVAHYSGMSKCTRLDATLCFVSDEGECRELWEDGDVGGFECYITAEGAEGESAEAAEVYRIPTEGGENDEDGGSLLSLSPAHNVLNLVLRDEGIMRFVKYVSARAPGSRWDVAVEYEITEEGEEG